MKQLPGECLRHFHFHRPDRNVPATLFVVRLSALDEARLSAVLSPEELKTQAELPALRRRRTWGSGRYALKWAAAALTKCRHPKDLEIATAILEYPILKAPFRDVPDLTLTHTDEMAAALAVEAGHACGIDWEKMDASREAVFRKVLTADEEAHAPTLGLSTLENAVVHWSLREALSKAVRCGFTVPFPILQVMDPRKHGAGSLTCHFRNFGQYAGSAWWHNQQVFAMVYPKKSRPVWAGTFWGPFHATGCLVPNP